MKNLTVLVLIVSCWPLISVAETREEKLCKIFDQYADLTEDVVEQYPILEGEVLRCNNYFITKDDDDISISTTETWLSN